jgi:hypothetical protein
MAIREIAPLPTGKPDTRTSKTSKREQLSESRAAKRLTVVASQLSVASLTDSERESKNFVMICVAIATAGLMTMFGLNIALTEGAFTVRELKLEVIEMKELRQAAQTELAYVSSPERLAQSAQLLGMEPSGKPRFIEIEK